MPGLVRLRSDPRENRLCPFPMESESLKEPVGPSGFAAGVEATFEIAFPVKKKLSFAQELWYHEIDPSWRPS